MPYIYSVKMVVSSLDQHGRTAVKINYLPANQNDAENHDNGYKALTNSVGEKVTPWIPIKREERIVSKLDYGKGVPLTDFCGQMLAAGDYVSTTIDKYAHLTLCEVVNFTKQKVRVRTLDENCRVTLKDISDIAKIPRELFH